MADGHFPTPDFQAQAEEIVARQQAARDLTTPVGVSWSAMSPDRPKVESIVDVIDRLADQEASRLDFRASPRGRFCTAIDALAEVGCYDDEVLRLRGYYNRSISALNGPALTTGGVAAVGESIALLNGIVGRDARAAVDALTDLLIAEAPLLAVA